MEDLRNSTLKFFSDQDLCHADILPPAQVIVLITYNPFFFWFGEVQMAKFWLMQARARIEVSVLNFLKILNASNPAISDLPLVPSSLCFLCEFVFIPVDSPINVWRFMSSYGMISLSHWKISNHMRLFTASVIKLKMEEVKITIWLNTYTPCFYFTLRDLEV